MNAHPGHAGRIAELVNFRRQRRLPEIGPKVLKRLYRHHRDMKRRPELNYCRIHQITPAGPPTYFYDLPPEEQARILRIGQRAARTPRGVGGRVRRRRRRGLLDR